MDTKIILSTDTATNLPQSFTVCYNDLKFLFRPVDMCNLIKTDKKFYVKHTNDTAAVKQMFGSKVAKFFYVASLADKKIAYKSIVEQIIKNKKNIPNYYHFDWFVELDGEVVACVGARTPDPNFNLGLSNVLEISATVINKYRGKGFATQMLRLFLSELKPSIKHLVKDADLFDITLSTIPTNVQVNKIALANNFKLITTVVDDIDFVLFTKKIEMDIYLLH